MVELKAGLLRCDVAPHLGAAITGLWLGSEPVLRSAPAASVATARQAGCYPLVPFSNRIGQASLVWEGTRHPLVRNNGDEPHAIHGVGWQRPWTVLEQEADSLLLAFEHRTDAHWPFAFDASQAIQLRPGGVALTLAMTNQSPQPAPAGLGWHPWFPKRPGSRIRFGATGRWEMGPDKLPTERSASRGLDDACDTLALDHCFDGWDGSVTLQDAALQVRITSSMRYLVVCTDSARDVIAIEPVSHVNNAVNLHAAGVDASALGLVVLQPGETLSAQMQIDVEGVR
jgi:aldose 1-epimerase